MYNSYFPQQRNSLPPQQIIQVNGKASVDTMQLAPNSSLLAMDITAPIVWMCVSDGIGNVTATPYDITLHEEKPAPDINNFEKRLINLETMVKEMSANAKPNAKTTKSKQDSSDD